MDPHRTPDELAAENELICEKLLGWKPAPVTAFGHKSWYPNPYGDDGEQWRSEPTPSFDTWAEAGLILEALAKAGQRPDLGYYTDCEWHCMINATDECMPNMFSTGPAAIRDAALAYIGSLP